MIGLRKVKQQIEEEPHDWSLHLMNFVDDFRRDKDRRAIEEPFELSDPKVDALLASTAEYLCDELKLPPPSWLAKIPPCDQPFFVGEIESLKAISIVESPLRFRIRKIFVLENFLDRT